MPASSKSFLSFTRAVATSENQPVLYCFTYAGGSCSLYAPWARALTPAITVLGVEMPGHGARFQEPPLDAVAAMAEEAANAIEAAASHAPYAFYGHSLGALVAFETARLLQRREHPRSLRHLFVGAARAPHLPPIMPQIGHLETAAFLDAVQHRYGGLPAVLFDEPELLEIVLPVLRADFSAYERYQFEGLSALDCPVTAFHGAEDAIVRTSAVSEWSRVTRGDFRIEELPGDHFFLNACRDTLLQTITASFNRSAASDTVAAAHL